MIYLFLYLAGVLPTFAWALVRLSRVYPRSTADEFFVHYLAALIGAVLWPFTLMTRAVFWLQHKE